MAPVSDSDAALAAKTRGNSAVAQGDFKSAIDFYSSGIDTLHSCRSAGFSTGRQFLDLDLLTASLLATLFCNRAHARQKRDMLDLALIDASSTMEILSQHGGIPNSESIRVKALFRRALCHEQLGNHSDAFSDINLALRTAPSNNAISEVAHRIRNAVDKAHGLVKNNQSQSRWQSEYRYDTKCLLQVAENLDGSVRGFIPETSDPVVRVPCGIGIAIHHGHGGLRSILPLGPPRRIPRLRELPNSGKVVALQPPPELGEEYFQRPIMLPSDGTHAKYCKGGDLVWLGQYKDGRLDGVSLRLEVEGSVRPAESGVYCKGELMERWQGDTCHDVFLRESLVEVVVPIKKALGVALAPGEERLCFEQGVNIDIIAPLELCGRPQNNDPDKLRVVTGQMRQCCEWWRPQIEFVDPSKLHDSQDDSFAPIGPATSGEATPYLGDSIYAEKGRVSNSI